MLEPFIINALLAGTGIAAMSGVLGCFVVWQRLAYFGDTIAHAALLGVVLALLLDAPVELGIIGVSLLLALGITQIQRRGKLGTDTLLGIAAHGALALGLVLLALSQQIMVDINHYLFGDILAVNGADIARIYACVVVTWLVITKNWRNLMMSTLHPDIAQVEGVPVVRMRMALMLVIALVVAVSIKVVGMLLVTSLLIIPAAAARYFARTPSCMVWGATLMGMASVVGGVFASLTFDTPCSPSIILAALVLFLTGYVLKGAKAR